MEVIDELDVPQRGSIPVDKVKGHVEAMQVKISGQNHLGSRGFPANKWRQRNTEVVRHKVQDLSEVRTQHDKSETSPRPGRRTS